MKILIACEESQVVTIAFRNKGHEAYSCDLVKCSGDHPEWHLQKDAISLLKKHNNIIVLAPRRSGKTFLAKYIIENNKDLKIGIVTNINPEVYVKYRNVSKYTPNKKYDLVITKASTAFNKKELEVTDEIIKMMKK